MTRVAQCSSMSLQLGEGDSRRPQQDFLRPGPRQILHCHSSAPCMFRLLRRSDLFCTVLPHNFVQRFSRPLFGWTSWEANRH